MFEVLILTAITLFVLSRLYVALGRDDGPPEGRPRPEPGATSPGAVNQPNHDVVAPVQTGDVEPVFTGPAAGGLEDIYAVDKTFDPQVFLRGARGAYELIVEAFANGDREALRPLLDDDVYEAWDEAIASRESDGEQPWRLLRVKRYEIDAADLDGQVARVVVRYEAELGDGEKTRTTRELWTYMRDVTSDDPNWILDDVEMAG